MISCKNCLKYCCWKNTSNRNDIDKVTPPFLRVRWCSNEINMEPINCDFVIIEKTSKEEPYFIEGYNEAVKVRHGIRLGDIQDGRNFKDFLEKIEKRELLFVGCIKKGDIFSYYATKEVFFYLQIKNIERFILINQIILKDVSPKIIFFWIATTFMTYNRCFQCSFINEHISSKWGYYVLNNMIENALK